MANERGSTLHPRGENVDINGIGFEATQDVFEFSNRFGVAEVLDCDFLRLGSL